MSNERFLQGLNAEGTKVLALITAFLAAEGLTVGEGFFASPEAWQEHEGQRMTNVVLVAVYDGATALKRVCSLDGEAYDLNERFQNALRAAGYYFEEHNHWYGCVFPR